tara:strand:- start:6 stop:323 length:318 start_codon:yes stop_codon:yes gene_type:complete
MGVQFYGLTRKEKAAKKAEIRDKLIYEKAVAAAVKRGSYCNYMNCLAARDKGGKHLIGDPSAKECNICNNQYIVHHICANELGGSEDQRLCAVCAKKPVFTPKKE